MIERTILPVANPDADLPQVDPSSAPAPLSVRLVTVIVIVAPLLGFVAAPFFVWGWGFSWVDLGLLLSMYLVTALGITVGFHRLFTHRSFETYVWVKVIFAILGMMAVQGSPLRWVAIHRRHHQHSDTPDDPHSPHHHGSGVLGVLRGFWHAYIGWFFDPDPPELDNYVKDLNKIQALWITDTLWRGIPLDTHFTDTTGRPVPLLPEGQPIRELP